MKISGSGEVGKKNYVLSSVLFFVHSSRACEKFSKMDILVKEIFQLFRELSPSLSLFFCRTLHKSTLTPLRKTPGYDWWLRQICLSRKLWLWIFINKIISNAFSDPRRIFQMNPARILNSATDVPSFFARFSWNDFIFIPIVFFEHSVKPPSSSTNRSHTFSFCAHRKKEADPNLRAPWRRLFVRFPSREFLSLSFFFPGNCPFSPASICVVLSRSGTCRITLLSPALAFHSSCLGYFIVWRA